MDMTSFWDHFDTTLSQSSKENDLHRNAPSITFDCWFMWGKKIGPAKVLIHVGKKCVLCSNLASVFCAHRMFLLSCACTRGFTPSLHWFFKIIVNLLSKGTWIQSGFCKWHRSHEDLYLLQVGCVQICWRCRGRSVSLFFSLAGWFSTISEHFT